jgi:hypothetical protein
MANIYSYDIGGIECYPNNNGLENQAIRVSYSYICEDENQTHMVSHAQTVELDEPDSENYIAFEDLTNEIIWGWIQPKIDLEQIKTALDSQLDSQMNPPTIWKHIGTQTI